MLKIYFNTENNLYYFLEKGNLTVFTDDGLEIPSVFDPEELTTDLWFEYITTVKN